MASHFSLMAISIASFEILVSSAFQKKFEYYQAMKHWWKKLSCINSIQSTPTLTAPPITQTSGFSLFLYNSYNNISFHRKSCSKKLKQEWTCTPVYRLLTLTTRGELIAALISRFCLFVKLFGWLVLAAGPSVVELSDIVDTVVLLWEFSSSDFTGPPSTPTS